MNTKVITCAALTLLLLAPGAFAQPPKPKAKPTQPPKVTPNQTKGQGQMLGANGRFGEIYTLTSGFNFQILSAKYALDPLPTADPLNVGPEQKLLVLTVAIKNSNPADNWFNTEGHTFTVVDTNNQNYTGNAYALQSKPGEVVSPTLRPGQGLGQADPATGKPQDALTFGILVPAKARITKVVLNMGRKSRTEEVVRYYVAGTTKAEAGEDGDPKNTIVALPEAARDPADKSGAVALTPGKALPGAFYPSGAYGLRLDTLTYSTTETYDNAAPESGKRYAIVTVTARNISPKEQSFFDLSGGDFPKFEMTDSEGETAKLTGMRKAKRDEYPEKTFKPGDEYTFRLFFVLPKDATAKTVKLASGSGFAWAIDGAAIQ